MKCEICKKNITETFLKKILGTVVKDKDGKKHSVCQECQARFKDKNAILSQLK